MGIKLEKGQKINLKKEDGTSLTKIDMGLGWDAAGFFGGSIDLDASVGLFAEDKSLVDTVSFKQLKSRDGSIKHSGDNLTGDGDGDGDGDDETISVDLSKVPANVKTLIFTVNSFRGQTFDKVKNCRARLVDKTSNTEIAKYTLDEKGGSNTGLIMAKVYRHDGSWKMGAIGAPCNGTTIQSIMSDIITHL